jgi:hypothetical protein
MNIGREEAYTCPICKRIHTSYNMEWHHLLPKDGSCERDEPRIYVCRTCHDVIHYCHTNHELRTSFNTLDLLLTSEKIENMVKLYKYDHKINKVYKIKKLKLLSKAA